MSSISGPADRGVAPFAEGVVSGAVLRLIRIRLELSQDAVAGHVSVDPNTWKSWETGRRPLGRVQVQTLRTLVRTLTRLGADPVLLEQLDVAIDVDLGITEMLATGNSAIDHPLGTVVHARAWHDLLAWALAGTTPAAMRGQGGAVPRPRLPAPERDRLFDHLRVAAERVNGDSMPASVLLRRQVYFVASWDSSGPGRDWLARMERQELRRLRPADGWTPTWVAGRSLAVARAAQGDPERLRRFIAEQLADDVREAANLNYWAYWQGEDRRPAVTDEFMAAGDLGQWRGAMLLRHLTAGLISAPPYVELTIHSVWALLQRRPWLLGDDPRVVADLRTGAQDLLGRDDLLGDQARRELGQIFYATNMRGQTR